MKKLKIGPSVFILILISLISKNFLLLLNYFCALLLHEMAHLFIAVLRGYSLKILRFDVFGMSVELEEKIADKDAFAINIAGPIFNLLIALICVAVYWFIPSSYSILNGFCVANIVIAIFNLLPVYPLDGGKIFRTFFNNEKHFRLTDKIVRIGLAVLFAIMFICSLNSNLNIYALVVSLFLLTSKPEFKPTFDLCREKNDKHFLKIVFVKANENDSLFDLLKKLKRKNYTIFYCQNAVNPYLDEDKLCDLVLKIPLQTKIKDLYN